MFKKNVIDREEFGRLLTEAHWCLEVGIEGGGFFIGDWEAGGGKPGDSCVLEATERRCFKTVWSNV